VQATARQNVRGHHQIQLALLERGLRVEGNARFEIHLHMRPLGAKTFQRRRQPLNTAMAFNRDTQVGLLWFIAGLQCAADLRQHLIGQLQQDFPCGVKRKGWLLRTKSRKPRRCSRSLNWWESADCV
jgi:hypothetical protein